MYALHMYALTCHTVMMSFFSVPVTACLVKRFGSRRISAIACVLIVSGIVLSAFSVKLWHLLLGYSVLAGGSVFNHYKNEVEKTMFKLYIILLRQFVSKVMQ